MTTLGSVSVKFSADLSDLNKKMKSAQDKIAATGKKFSSIGKSLSTSISAPLAAAGVAAFSAANKIDGALNAIQVGTGATGESLKGLENDFREVFGNVPTDANSAASAISNLNTLTKATGPVLQELTKSVLEASRVLGEDATANSKAFGQAMQQWQIPAEQGTDKLDSLFKATQDYGVGLSDLLGQLNSYGSVLLNVGFSMEETADLFGRMNAAGIQVSRVMPSLNKAFRDWSAEGKDARLELQRVITQMENAETGTEALKIATENFGSEGVQRLTTAIRSGAIPSLDELGGALENTEGLVRDTGDMNRTFGDSMALMGNRIMLAAEPLGGSLIDAFESLEPLLMGAIDKVKKLTDWFADLGPTGQKVALGIAAAAVAIPPLLVGIGSLITAFGTLNLVTGGILLAIGALITAGVALVANWDTVSQWSKKMGYTVWGAVHNMRVKVIDSLIKIIRGIKSLTNVIPGIGTAVDTVIAKLEGMRSESEATSRRMKLLSHSVDSNTSAVEDNGLAMQDMLDPMKAQRMEQERNTTSLDVNTMSLDTNTSAKYAGTSATRANTSAIKDEYTVMEQLTDKLGIVGKQMDLFRASTDLERESTEYLTKELEFQREKLAIVDEQVRKANESYLASVEAKGKDAEATRKLQMELLGLQTQQADLRGEIDDTTESMQNQFKAKKKMTINDDSDYDPNRTSFLRRQIDNGGTINDKEYEKYSKELEELAKKISEEEGVDLGVARAMARSKIPGLVRGGTVTSEGLTWVGEKGPELLNMPKGAQVTPNYDLPKLAMSETVGGGVTVNVYGSVGVRDIGEQIVRELRLKGIGI